MEGILTRRKLVTLSILTIITCITFIIGNILYNQYFFFVKSSSPRNHSTIPVNTRQAIITFNKELDLDQDIYKDIKIEPQTRIYQDITIENNKLIINFSALDIDTTYSITFKKIEATNGKIINDFTYKVKTKFTPFNKLSEDEKRKEVDSINSGSDSDKVLAVTPHSTLDYTIERTYKTRDDGSAYLVLIITVMLTGADRGNESAATEKYKLQALNYLRSKGIDPTEYTIEYRVKSAIF